MKKLYGVITAMTTPFAADGKLDVEAIKEQVEFLIEKGVDCLYPAGTTGEMYLMTVEERKQLAKEVVKAAAGRVTVFVHVGAMSQEDTICLARHAQEIGADGIGIVTPSYFTVDERAMIQYYKEVCASVSHDFPVYVYAIPQLAHNDIGAETMEKICRECRNVVGIKYSNSDMTRILQYLRINNGDFSVVVGADHLFLPALAIGADGTVSGCSGPFPEAFAEVYRQYKAGNMEAARKAQDNATTLAWLMKSGTDMSIFKNILSFRGMKGGHMRKPLLDLAETDVQALKETMTPYLPPIVRRNDYESK